MKRTNKKLHQWAQENNCHSAVERGVSTMKMYKLTEPAIATYSLGTRHAIGVFEIDITDRMKIAWINGNERDAFRWLKVRYDKEGDAYIFTGKERRYLKDFY